MNDCPKSAEREFGHRVQYVRRLLEDNAVNIKDEIFCHLDLETSKLHNLIANFCSL